MARKALANGQWIEGFMGFFIIFLTSCPEWLKCMLLAPPFNGVFTTLSETQRLVVIKSDKNLVGQEEALHKYLRECMAKAMPEKPVEETKAIPQDVADAIKGLKDSVQARGGKPLDPAASEYLLQTMGGSSQRTAPQPPKPVVSWACVWKRTDQIYKALESTQDRVFGVFRDHEAAGIEAWVIRSETAFPFPCEDREYFDHGKVVEHCNAPKPDKSLTMADLPPIDPKTLAAGKKAAAKRKPRPKKSAMDQDLDKIPGLREDLENING